MNHPPIQVLGAGLTGMAAAHSLGNQCQLHEKRSRVGGHVVTVEEQGFRFDRTGHLLHLRDPELRSFIHKWLGPDVLSIQRRSKIFSHGVYTRYPYQANTFGLPPQVAHECVMGFLRCEAAQPAGSVRAPSNAPPTSNAPPASTAPLGSPAPQANPAPPANFEEYCLRYFGEGFSRHFMVPYNSKLWGVHPREITAEWCSRFVPRPKLEDVIAGAVGLNRGEVGYNASFTYPKTGIGVLSDALGRSVEDRLQLNHAPDAVDWRAKQLVFGAHRVPYSVLISTAPLNTLVRLLVAPPVDVVHAARALRCNGLYYFDVALNAPCPLDLHWIYVPEERFPFYRVGCYSNFSSAMAPDGKANLYVELAGRKRPEVASVLPEVIRGLVEMGVVKRHEDVRFARLRHLGHAYVVFDHNYYASVARVQDFLKNEGIISAGRYGAWNYSSMEDALIYGRDAATQAQNML